jgi:selenocysteine-specific translation elongation factor
MTNQVAIFKLHRTFNLTGRGQVLVGDILEGYVDQGNTLSLPINDDPVNLEIISVEVVDTTTENEAKIGLVIRSIDDALILAINANSRMMFAVFEQTG